MPLEFNTVLETLEQLATITTDTIQTLENMSNDFDIFISVDLPIIIKVAVIVAIEFDENIVGNRAGKIRNYSDQLSMDV